MISNILIPTDFSASAENALKSGILLAQKTGAALHLLHVNIIPVADSYFPAVAYPEYLESIEAASKENFEKLKAKFSKENDIKFISTSVMGFVYEEIKSYAEQNKIDLIVMGTKGESSFAETLFGSNTVSVINRTNIPVLVVPEMAKISDFKKITYASDFFEPEFPCVSRLVYLANLFNAEINVLHVKSKYDKYFNPSDNFFVKNKKNISYANLKIIQSADDNIMDGIERFAKESNSDLVIVAKHNRHLFDRLFHRSLSKEMLYHTKIPLLILNKDEKWKEDETNSLSQNIAEAVG